MTAMKHVATALVAAGFATAAHAGSALPGTLTQTGVVAQTLADFDTPFTVTGGAGATTFAGFNSVLGTLTGVTVTYSVNAIQTGTLVNTRSSTETAVYLATSSLSVLDGGNTPAALLSDLSSFKFQVAAASYKLAGNASASVLPTANAFGTGTAVQPTFTITDPASLAEFIGTNFTLDLKTLTSDTVLGNGTVVPNVTTLEGGNISIVYDYTPPSAPPTMVPEPATLAAFAAGLAGLTFVRRRRRRA